MAFSEQHLGIAEKHLFHATSFLFASLFLPSRRGRPLGGLSGGCDEENVEHWLESFNRWRRVGPLTCVHNACISKPCPLFDRIWPPTDIPMHFSGGVAIAFFISRCYQLLPRESVKRSRVELLELLLIGSLTASVAVFWEFAEFSADQLFGTNVQISLANTMQDMAMGILGTILLIAIRIRQLRVGTSELREITFDWICG